MKTGIVMEVGRGSAVVMLNGGQFQKVEPQADWKVGKVVALAPERKPISLNRTLLLAAACMVFVVTSIVVSYQFLFRTVSVIGLDINPSISLELNRLDRVTFFEGLNDDGSEILQDIQLSGMNYTDALDVLLADDDMVGYLERGEYLVFTLYSASDPDGLQANIEQVLQQVHTRHENLEISLLNVDEGDLEQAQREGISPARLLMVRQLARLDPTITADTLDTMNISGLHSAIVSSGGDVTGSDNQSGALEHIWGRPESSGKPNDGDTGGNGADDSNNGNSNNGNSNNGNSNNGNSNNGNSNNGNSNNGNSNNGNSNNGNSNNGNSNNGNSNNGNSNNGNSNNGNSNNGNSNNGNSNNGNSNNGNSNNGNSNNGNSNNGNSNNGNSNNGNSNNGNSNNGNSNNGNSNNGNSNNGNSNNGNSNNGNSNNGNSNNGNSNNGNSNNGNTNNGNSNNGNNKSNNADSSSTDDT